MSMQKILIVEDDEKLRNELEIFLGRNGYLAEGINEFDDTLRDILKARANMILLDVNLPNVDGEYLLREIRRQSDVPVIMITSRDSEMDELLSMHYGADNYVTKPFNTQLLLAKIQVILRRTRAVEAGDSLDCGAFSLNLSKSRIEKDGEAAELTGNELKILRCLIKAGGNIVSRDEIMNELWDSEAFIDDNTLTVNVARIRRKLEDIGLCGVIVTRRGQGYQLVV
ncbi:MAG: response regulator transcription factor [Clostridiales bacterium]|nr:response regulator transcription factor [Clostridiales bacterium]